MQKTIEKPRELPLPVVVELPCKSQSREQSENTNPDVRILLDAFRL